MRAVSLIVDDAGMGDDNVVVIFFFGLFRGGSPRVFFFSCLILRTVLDTVDEDGWKIYHEDIEGGACECGHEQCECCRDYSTECAIRCFLTY